MTTERITTEWQDRGIQQGNDDLARDVAQWRQWALNADPQIRAAALPGYRRTLGLLRLLGSTRPLP